MRFLFLLGLAVLLGVGCDVSDHTDGVDLFNQYFSIYPIELSEQTLEVEPLLVPAYHAYQARDFETVVDLTTDFTNNVRRLPLVMMAQSMGLIETEQYATADSILNILQAHPAIRADVLWYRALLSVRDGEYATSERYLADLRLYGTKEQQERAEELAAQLKG